MQNAFLALLLHGRQIESVLMGEGFKNRIRLQTPRHQVRDGIRQNDRKHNGVIAADLKNHEDRSQRHA